MSDDRNLLNTLGELARIEPDAESTRRAIERTRQAVADLHQPWYSEYGRKLMSRRNVAAALAALVVIAVSAHWLLPTNSTAAFAFAEVQEQVKKTKSVQYVEIRKDKYKDDIKSPEEERRVMILGTHLQREEIKVTRGGKLPEGVVWVEQPAHYIMIHNAKTGKLVFLYPDEKQYSSVHELLGIDVDDPNKKVERTKVAPQPNADFYTFLREVPTDKAKKLPEKTIDGKHAVGFVVEEKAEKKRGAITIVRTYWVNTKTKLPVRIEASYRSTIPQMVDSDWVLRDFVFDAPLDEALFSTDMPAGYTEVSKEKERKPAK